MYLKDLIETNHVFMKLLEHLGKKQRNLIVLCKSRQKKTSKSIYFTHRNFFGFCITKYYCFSPESKIASRVEPEDDDTMWANFSPDIKEIIQMRELVVDANEARPYDPISEVSMDDQK